LALNQGFILTSMILASVFVWVAELNFSKAALWCLAAAGLSFFGVIHAYEIGPLGVESHFGFNAAPSFCLAYLASALLLWAMQTLGLEPERDTAMAHALISGERRENSKGRGQKRSKRAATRR
jgi:AGZA family xanthine/uracil permease-like MFS transporter